MNFGLSFPVLITPINEGVIVSEEKYEVRTCEAEHSVPTFSFLLEEKEKPGTFYPEKATALGVPKGELWHKLQQGEEIVVDGKSIKPSEVMGPNVPGKKIGVSGDTRPTKKLEVFFKNCDYLVFDSTFSDEMKEKAIQSLHSTAKEAATFAKNSNVSNLILTHFSARYKDENVLLDEAKTVHSSVIAAHDQLKIDII
jgi:ribonuclease Z